MTSSDNKNLTEQDLDQLHSTLSRVSLIFGDKTKNFFNASVLIVGMDGLGLEIAKNLCLSGIRNFYLFDQNNVITYRDLGTCFYEEASAKGRNKVNLAASEIGKMNTSASVIITDSNIFNKDFYISNKDLLWIFTDPYNVFSDINHFIKITDDLHRTGIKYIVAETFGLVSRVFCDYGNNYIVDDDGEQIASIHNNILKFDKISNNVYDMTVASSDITGNFQESMTVCLVLKCKDLIKMIKMKIKNVKLDTIKSDITSETVSTSIFHLECDDKKELHHLEEYLERTNKDCKVIGLKEYKTPKTFNFISFNDINNLKSNVVQHEIYVNGAEEEYDRLASKAIKMLYTKCTKKDDFPLIWDTTSATEFARNFKNDEYNVADEMMSILLIFAFTCRANLCPINSITGGIAAQEALKLFSKKFNPLYQTIIFNFHQCLYREVDALENFILDSGLGRLRDLDQVFYKGFKEDHIFNPRDSEQLRYYDQVRVFGKKFQRKLINQKWMLIGAGALGCEYLKNFAMMGLGCVKENDGLDQKNQPQGRIYLTDMDSIEKSNLSRQLLFRENDINKLKSKVAAEAALKINKYIRINAYDQEMSAQTEGVFEMNTNELLLQIDGVCNALDNVEARIYIDSRCHTFCSWPVIESGLEGLKGNVQVIYPGITERYSGVKVVQKSYNSCTVKSFPSIFPHTVQWAQEHFIQLFCENNFYKTFHNLDQTGHPDIKDIINFINFTLIERPKSFEDCVIWARSFWEISFVKIIKQLIKWMKESKSQRKFPTPLKFDMNDSTTLLNIISVANLRAIQYKIKLPRANEIEKTVLNILGQLSNDDGSNINHMYTIMENDKVFEQRSVTEINTNREKLMKTNSLFAKNMWTLIKNKRREDPNFFDFVMNKFDKDNEDHINFIHSCAVLRARNYEIIEQDKLETKKIVGNIIPAVVSVAGAIVGFNCLEVIKCIQGPFEKKTLAIKKSERNKENESNNTPSIFDSDYSFRCSYMSLGTVDVSSFEPVKEIKTKKIFNNQLEINDWSCILVKNFKIDGTGRQLDAILKSQLNLLLPNNKIMIHIEELDDKHNELNSVEENLKKSYKVYTRYYCKLNSSLSMHDYLPKLQTEMHESTVIRVKINDELPVIIICDITKSKESQASIKFIKKC